MVLILSSDQSQKIQLQSQPLALTVKERWLYASKKLSLFIGLTIASLFIPVFHFVLVPTLSLVSIFIFIKSLKMKHKIILSSQTNCLKCQKDLSAIYLLDDDFRIKCPHCYQSYLIA